MKIKTIRILSCAAALTAAFVLHGCAYRATDIESAETPAPEGTAVPELTVEFRLGDTVLSDVTVPYGSEMPEAPKLPDGYILIEWTAENGSTVGQPITGDTVYTAVARPEIESDSVFLFADENGLVRPESTMTYAECAAAVRSLVPENALPTDLLAELDASPDEELTREDLLEVLQTLFAPEAAEKAFLALPETDAESATRAEFAYCTETLLGGADDTDTYFPDVSPKYWAYKEMAAAVGSGTLTAKELEEKLCDGFLWIDGYLYRLDEDGYFLTDTEYDGLYFDKNGRYTSGSADLDAYVAQTVDELWNGELTRLENLKILYDHVKNDFKYLKRNYYDSGETGWDINEALTIFETGKGNCYCYAGAFCYLARGIGYNARTWSGSLGTENQPHAWTEITIGEQIYICDPEIEMNYWLLENYTDNFMMKVEQSAGWNYQAEGRETPDYNKVFDETTEEAAEETTDTATETEGEA